MTVDFSVYKTPVFANINGTPIVPTAAKSGNASDLISRVNGLIDELQTTIDALPSDSGGTLNWSVNVPASLDNDKIEVYYLNVTENYLYTSIGINLQITDYLRGYVLGDDFTAGGTIDISDIIQQNGVGYYFFLFRKPDVTFKEDSRIESIETTLKGSARQFDKELQVAGYDNQNNAYISQRVKPLVVTTALSTVTITLRDDQEINLG